MTFFRTLTGKLMDWVVSLSLIALVVVVFLQVFYRYIFAAPITWSEEMARFIFVWIALMGTFLALKSKGHISIETFINHFFSSEVRGFI
jgi:TRAP-type transport system small permease protein